MRLRLSRCTSWVKRWSEAMDFFQTFFKTNMHTGCDSHFRNPVVFNILKEPLLVQKQTIPQQKALDLSFNLAP